jgi:hypothetical protein
VIRAFNRLATALLAACVVLGPPTVAVLWAIHQPWRELRTGDVRAWIADPPDEAVIWLLVATAAAGLWLLIATVVLRVAIRAGRQAWRRLRHLRLPTPAQATASSLAGTALLGIPAVTAAPADTPTQPATAGSEHHHDPHGPPDDRHEQRQDDPDFDAHRAGIDLPGGGWIPYPTALAVTAVSSLIWLHRRQHHPADPPQFGQHHHDADLQPLPTAAQAISAAVTAEDPTPPPPPSDLAVLPDLPAGRLTLYGPGAADAARGLLATTVLHTALSTTVACRITLPAEPATAAEHRCGRAVARRPRH